MKSFEPASASRIVSAIVWRVASPSIGETPIDNVASVRWPSTVAPYKPSASVATIRKNVFIILRAGVSRLPGGEATFFGHRLAKHRVVSRFRLPFAARPVASPQPPDESRLD